MPSTKRMITMLLKNANGWDRTGDNGILPVLNDASNLLLQTENEQALKLEDGEFPSLTTEDGVYEYELSDVWKISMVMVKYDKSGDYGFGTGYDYSYRTDYVARNEHYNFRGKKYMRIKQISTKTRIPGNSSTGQTNAKVIFNFNPKDTSDIFLYRGYELPTQLTSENIPIQIPSEELQLRALFPSTQLLIEAYQNGNWDEAFEKILSLYKPMVQKELNAGEQGAEYFVTQRGV